MVQINEIKLANIIARPPFGNKTQMKKITTHKKNQFDELAARKLEFYFKHIVGIREINSFL